MKLLTTIVCVLTLACGAVLSAKTIIKDRDSIQQVLDQLQQDDFGPSIGPDFGSSRCKIVKRFTKQCGHNGLHAAKRKGRFRKCGNTVDEFLGCV